MYRSFRIVSMKIAALTGVFCVIYTLIIAARIALSGQETFLQDIAFHYLVALEGYILGLIIVGDRKGKLPVLLMALAGLLTAFTVFFLYRDRGVWEGALEALFVLILYFLGFRAFYTPFSMILSSRKAVAGAVIIAVFMGASLYFTELIFARRYVMFFLYIFLASFLLVKNQSGIDEAFIKRHIDHAVIPGKMRKYNTSLIAGMYIAIVVLTNIRAIVRGLAAALRFVVLNSIYVLFQLFLFLSGLFKQGKAEAPSGDAANMLPDLGENSGNGIVSIILTVIMCILGAMVLYAIIKRLPAALSSAFKKLKRTLLRFFEFLKRLFKMYGGEPEEADDYEDEIETLKERENGKKTDAGKRYGNVGKQLGRIKDPVQKIRFIYGVILHGLKSKDIEILKSDTTSEVLNKSRKLEEVGKPLSRITEVYEQVRYAEAVPDAENIESSEANFLEISKRLGIRKK